MRCGSGTRYVAGRLCFEGGVRNRVLAERLGVPFGFVCFKLMTKPNEGIVSPASHLLWIRHMNHHAGRKFELQKENSSS